MKKVLIGLGSVLLIAFIVVLAANANGSTQEDKKAKTEVKKDCSKCPGAATCDQAKDGKTVTCDPEKCKKAGCDHKDGKCDPATCVAHKEGENKEGHACGSTATCAKPCQQKAEVVN